MLRVEDEEEGGADQAAGGLEGRTPRSQGCQGDWRSCFKAFQNVSFKNVLRQKLIFNGIRLGMVTNS